MNSNFDIKKAEAYAQKVVAAVLGIMTVGDTVETIRVKPNRHDRRRERSILFRKYADEKPWKFPCRVRDSLITCARLRAQRAKRAGK